MKTQKVKRTRCTCDFCGKKNWSVWAMKMHEEHCTMNPERTCRVCALIENEQRPIDEIKATIAGCVGIEADQWESEPEPNSIAYRLEALRRASGDCPACIMAAVRQSGFAMWMLYGFNYKKEMKSLLDDVAESRHPCYESGPYYSWRDGD